jgi:hypothetical protein
MAYKSKWDATFNKGHLILYFKILQRSFALSAGRDDFSLECVFSSNFCSVLIDALCSLMKFSV